MICNTKSLQFTYTKGARYGADMEAGEVQKTAWQICTSRKTTFVAGLWMWRFESGDGDVALEHLAYVSK